MVSVAASRVSQPWLRRDPLAPALQSAQVLRCQIIQLHCAHSGVTKNEMLLWHQQYLACCAELNQWDTVAEYAKFTDNCPLQIDAMVQLHEWQYLKAVCLRCNAKIRCHYSWKMLVSVACAVHPLQMVLPKAQIDDNADATIVRAQMHLQELQVVDVDRICKQVWLKGLVLNGHCTALVWCEEWGGGTAALSARVQHL